MADDPIVRSEDDRRPSGPFSATALCWYAYVHGTDTITRAARNGDDINQRESGWTPLHWSAWSRSDFDAAGTIEVLVRLGGDPDAKDDDRMTPLHLAAMRNFPLTATSLVQAGADVDPRNRWGWSPLHIAAANGNIEVAKELLILHHADVNAKERTGATPLHLASHYWKMTELLLLHGADWKLRNNNGETPLAQALRLDETASVKALRKRGANE